MPIREFVETGYLHELNRTFLHPLGLAMEVRIEENGEWSLGGVWDSREDPEGFLYAEGTLDYAKAERILQIRIDRTIERVTRLGYWVQPVEKKGDPT